MNIAKFSITMACAASLLLMTACDTNPAKPDAPVAAVPTRKVVVVPPKESPEQIAIKTARMTSEGALTEIIALYDAGDYNAVIKRVSGPNEIRAEDKDLQVRAMKYMAFSYCVTNRQTLCRQQFEKILKTEPSFDLAPGEKGHPQWQAAFDRVKKTRK